MALLDMFFAIYALVMLSDRPRSAPLDDIDRQRARKKEIPS
jgi:sugar phosphate permease